MIAGTVLISNSQQSANWVHCSVRGSEKSILQVIFWGIWIVSGALVFLAVWDPFNSIKPEIFANIPCKSTRLCSLYTSEISIKPFKGCDPAGLLQSTKTPASQKHRKITKNTTPPTRGLPPKHSFQGSFQLQEIIPLKHFNNCCNYRCMIECF